MRPLRLVLVTRRFWPLVGGAERAMANLATAFGERGHTVTVLTAAWQPGWPDRLEHGGAQVVRLAQPPQRFWGTWRYMRSLEHWLADHSDAIDLALVSTLKHDAYATLGAAQGRFPVVLRAEGAGATGDCHWHEHANFGRWIRRRCRAAAAVVAPSPAIRQELLTAGFAAAQIESIGNGVAAAPLRDAPRRTEARRALSTGNLAFRLAETTPLVVYTGRLQAGKGLSTLVQAWPAVLARQSDARLWLVGEGPTAQSLEAEIAALRLTGRVLLAGAFDSVDEILAASDLFVLPSLEEGMSLALLEAMAQGLPIVASDIAGNRGLLTAGEHALLLPPGDPNAWAAAVLRLLADRPLGEKLGAAARARVDREFSLTRMVDSHLALFDRLTAGHPDSP